MVNKEPGLIVLEENGSTKEGQVKLSLQLLDLMTDGCKDISCRTYLSWSNKKGEIISYPKLSPTN